MSKAELEPEIEKESDEPLIRAKDLMALFKTLHKLRARLLVRLELHAEPDVTRTGANIRAFVAFLLKMERSVQTRRGVQLLLANQALFNINQLYRPTRDCAQPVFEAERNLVIKLWQSLINRAARALEKSAPVTCTTI